MDRDCGNRTCSVSYRLVPTCQIYVDKTDEEHCDFPCSVAHCILETHYWIDCPFWSCQDKITTTAVPDTTTQQPTPIPAASCTGALCITSLTFNAVLILVCLLLVFLIRKIKRNSDPSNDTGLANPLFDQDVDYFVHQGPILRNRNNSERLPLLPLHGTPSSTPARFATVHANTRERQRSSDSTSFACPTAMSNSSSLPTTLNISESHF